MDGVATSCPACSRVGGRCKVKLVDLPPELLCRIFSFLPNRELVKAHLRPFGSHCILSIIVTVTPCSMGYHRLVPLAVCASVAATGSRSLWPSTAGNCMQKFCAICFMVIKRQSQRGALL